MFIGHNNNDENEGILILNSATKHYVEVRGKTCPKTEVVIGSGGEELTGHLKPEQIRTMMRLQG